MEAYKNERPVKKIRMVAVSCILLAAMLSASQSFGRQRPVAPQTETKVKQANAMVNASQAATEKNLSAWDIIEMTSWLFWPFVLLTGIGIMLLTLKSLQELQEKTRGAALLNRKIGVRDLKAVLRIIQETPACRASGLMHSVIATFNKTNKAEPIGDDINTYLNTERESFETFHRTMGFLSDTAGALGLLGTVWGIFETFHSGKMDGPTILQGMSISLVTTLVGLVISLVLNAGATSIFSMFNKGVNLLATRAEELRQALLFIENRQTAGVDSVRTVSNNSHFARRPSPASNKTYQENGDIAGGFSRSNTAREAVPAGHEHDGWL